VKTSELGLKKLIAREGVRTKAYKDSVGIWTIGVGHTSAAGPPEVHPGLELSVSEINEVLARDIVKFEDAVKRNVKVPLEQHEFDALVSFVFNIGEGGFRKSKTLKLLNAGQKEAAGKAMMGWVKPPEITGRRKSEVQQYLTPYNQAEKPAGKPKAPAATPVAKGEKKPVSTSLRAKLGAFLTSVGLGAMYFAQEHPYVVIGAVAVAAGGVWLVLKHFSKE
jgi:lysozyme